LRISKAGIHFAFDTFVSGTYLALRFIIGCKKKKIHIAISYIYIYISLYNEGWGKRRGGTKNGNGGRR
jgi:hypothetical protein